MKIGRIIFFSYCVFLSSFITVGALASVFRGDNPFLFIIFFPVILFFSLTLVKKPRNSSLKKILIYYNFVIVTIMMFMGFLGTSSFPQLISAVLFFPIACYFWLLTFPKRGTKLTIPDKVSFVKAQAKKPAEEGTYLGRGFDKDRRIFIKLIGSTGLSLFFLSIFTKKAQAAFFGSVPGPGTVALKDTTGAQIDPAIKQPTDGYKISYIDDSTPAYYGFVDKTGRWFIMKEEATGAYLYYKGDTNFSDGWDDRERKLYGYFNTIFG